MHVIFARGPPASSSDPAGIRPCAGSRMSEVLASSPRDAQPSPPSRGAGASSRSWCRWTAPGCAIPPSPPSPHHHRPKLAATRQRDLPPTLKRPGVLRPRCTRPGAPIVAGGLGAGATTAVTPAAAWPGPGQRRTRPRERCGHGFGQSVVWGTGGSPFLSLHRIPAFAPASESVSLRVDASRSEPALLAHVLCPVTCEAVYGGPLGTPGLGPSRPGSV